MSAHHYHQNHLHHFHLVLRYTRVAKTLQSSITKQEGHQLAQLAKEVGVYSLVLPLLLLRYQVSFTGHRYHVSGNRYW